MSQQMNPLSLSWLFVPGNSEKMLSRFPNTGADAVILDLEDSVPPQEKAGAREAVARALKEHAEGVGVEVPPPPSPGSLCASTRQTASGGRRISRP